MKYRVRVLARANRDIDRIFAWLAKRSPGGATAWYEAALQALNDLSDNADQHDKAQEGQRLAVPIREAFFKTKRGKRYRLLYRIDGDEVRVMRIHCPGQPRVRRRDLE
jgi:plasmid stabilization system protein ParE